MPLYGRMHVITKADYNCIRAVIVAYFPTESKSLVLNFLFHSFKDFVLLFVSDRLVGMCL